MLVEKRRNAIERANKILYEESDRMKTFHSKMMLCDVLAEREAQVALKEELGKLEQIREERYLEMERQATATCSSASYARRTTSARPRRWPRRCRRPSSRKQPTSISGISKMTSSKAKCCDS